MNNWLVPQWPAPANVHAVFTTRAGGTSMAPFDSLNLGDHVGDRSMDVAANRALLVQAIQAQPVFLSQVHEAHVVSLSGATAHATQADACITDQPGTACTILVADCLAVLLTNAQGNRVAAAHAGWRGLAGHGGRGVLEAVLERLRTSPATGTASDDSSILAWLGPCIGPAAFAVGADVRDAFAEHDRAALAMFTALSDNKWLANLPGLARLRLTELGVSRIYGNDGSRPWCTVSNPAQFFSHRRDRVSGRMAACIWLD